MAGWRRHPINSRGHRLIPFTSLDVRPEDILALCETLSTGWITTGDKCRQFEEALTASIGAAFVLVTSSLTAAVGPLVASMFGDNMPRKAIVPTWTFTAVPMELAHLDIEIELADVDPGTLMLPVRSYDADLIVPTHLFGNRYDVAALKQANPGAVIIDDAAHLAPDARDLSGTSASLYSFYATKPLPTGEGGAVAIPSDGALADRFRAARLHGIARASSVSGGLLANLPYDVPGRGWKANMTDLAASLGLSQLPRIEASVSRRRDIVGRYAEAFDCGPVELIRHGSASSFHIAAARLAEGRDRATFMAELARRGIGSSVHFTPLHRLSYWAETAFGTGAGDLLRSGEAARRFPVAEANADRVVSLPLSSKMTDAEVEHVIDAVRSI